jgi:hypothetical protein
MHNDNCSGVSTTEPSIDTTAAREEPSTKKPRQDDQHLAAAAATRTHKRDSISPCKPEVMLGDPDS